ncbi:MAG: type II toxin-antitoxin system VapC family toxin [Bryobacterales bacterium]|nr:type II toxin-antitoxin system VapC family toxin [Bryobacterales bacterium]
MGFPDLTAMAMPDVNLLVYAHREDSSPEHLRYAQCLKKLAVVAEPYALSVLALAGFARIGKNRRIFSRPSSPGEAFAFVREMVDRPNARVVGPGPGHLENVTRLCLVSGASGNLVADAQHAAIAIEHGCTLVSTDSDFARFRDLRWRHPLAPAVGN